MVPLKKVEARLVLAAKGLSALETQITEKLQAAGLKAAVNATIQDEVCYIEFRNKPSSGDLAKALKVLQTINSGAFRQSADWDSTGGYAFGWPE